MLFRSSHLCPLRPDHVQDPIARRLWVKTQRGRSGCSLPLDAQRGFAMDKRAGEFLAQPNQRLAVVPAAFVRHGAAVLLWLVFVCNNRTLWLVVSKKMGFDKRFAVTGQTYDRKVDSEIMNLLANIAQSAHKFTNDLRLLQRAEIGRASCRERV